MPMNEYILGITGIKDYSHDNSAVIIKNGEILFAASEERYSRKKHDCSFPFNAIRNAFSYLKIRERDIKNISIGYPKRNILSILKNHLFYELIFFLCEILVYRNIFLLKDSFVFLLILLKHSVSNKEVQKFLSKKNMKYVDHHLAHGASAYYLSGYDETLCVVLDAFGPKLNGDIRSGAVFYCKKENIKEIMSVPIYASLGLFYQAITMALGFTPGDGEGKTMGLAAYGDPDKLYKEIKKFAPSFSDGKWKQGEDWISSITSTIPSLNNLYYSTRFGKTIKKLLNEEKKEDIAATTQLILEEEILKLVTYHLKKHPAIHNICLAGGVFLNVKANKKISELKTVRDVFVQPHAGDGGTAMGAALISSKIKPNKQIVNCGLGQSYSDSEILRWLKKFKKDITYSKEKNIVEYTADQLTNGKVIGWFQGRAEWGPRALGFRSVLADPRDIRVKDRINKVLKNREWFMPFAPSVLEEKAPEYFENCKQSPFMTFVFDVVSGKEKKIPAAIHIDNTARPNTVNENNNKIYYQLLNSFYKRTGVPVILNTSFNRHGLPIVNSPKDAVEHLLMGAVDELIIGSYSVRLKKLW